MHTLSSLLLHFSPIAATHFHLSKIPHNHTELSNHNTCPPQDVPEKERTMQYHFPSLHTPFVRRRSPSITNMDYHHHEVSANTHIHSSNKYPSRGNFLLYYSIFLFLLHLLVSSICPLYSPIRP